MENTDDLVEVVDLTFLVAVPGVNGEPAKLHYTLREHQDDRLGQEPGAAVIQFGPRELPNGKRLAGKKVTLNTMHIVGLEREVRLEKRVRPSIATLVDPQRELREKAGIVPATA